VTRVEQAAGGFDLFDALYSFGVALFITNFWSKWRYGFFDLFCAAAAIAGAFATPLLIERYFKLLSEIGGLEAETGGALLGCLLYDALWSARS
jgi:hypothetical protein